jgi:hypothetical protein
MNDGRHDGSMDRYEEAMERDEESIDRHRPPSVCSGHRSLVSPVLSGAGRVSNRA